MSGIFDPIELADEIAAIASTTRDPETADKLMMLVHRLLGTSPNGHPGGGEPPTPWVSEPAYEQA